MNCCGHCHLVSLPHFENLVTEKRIDEADVRAARTILATSDEWESYASLLVILRNDAPIGFFLYTPSFSPVIKMFPEYVDIKGVIQSEICSELEVTGVL